MFRKLLTAVACGVVATPLFMGTAPAAVERVDHPSQVAYRDGPGDVWVHNGKKDTWDTIGDFPKADVLHARVAYRDKALVVRAKYVDLKRAGNQEFRSGAKTRAYHFGFVLLSTPKHRDGKLMFWGDDGSTSCTGFTGKISYAKDFVRMRIPRTCLHNARWVRSGIGSNMRFHDPNLGYFDNPVNHRAEGPATVRLYHPAS